MLKKLSKKSGRIAIVSLLTVLIIASCVAPALVWAAPVDSQKVGGTVAFAIGKEFGKLGADLVDRTILNALGKAANATSGTDLEKVLNATRKILGGGQGVANAKILQACAQIQNQIAELDLTVRASGSHTDTMLGTLITKLSESAYSKQRTTMLSFSNSYNEVIALYSGLTDALQVYCADAENGADDDKMTEDLIKLKSAYDKVESFSDTMKPNSDPNSPVINFVNDLNNTYLASISPYKPSVAINTVDDITEENNWGPNTGSDTYLTYANMFFNSVFVAENQIYDYMVMATNEATSPLITYLTAYEMYSEYMAFKINSDPSYCDNEVQRQADLERVWSGYFSEQNKGIRGIYQMFSLYRDDMLKMMRTYDTSQNLQMDYQQKEEHKVDNDEMGGETQAILSATGRTGDYRWFYVVKPKNTNSVYAISKWNANGKSLYSNNLAVEWAYRLLDEYYTASQDYYNLQSTKADGRDPGFKTINNADELLDLTTAHTAWATSTKYFDYYLRDALQLEDIPDLSSMYTTDRNHGPYMLLDESNVTHDNWGTNDSMMKFLTIGVKWDSTSSFGGNYTVNLSSEDVCLKNFGDATPAYVVMKNTETINRTLSLKAEGGRAALYDAGGSKQLDSGSSKKFNGGTVLELRMVPDAGKTIDKIELFGANDSSKPIAVLFDSAPTVVDPADSSVSETFDVSDSLPQLSDGSYQFQFSSPYQNSTVKVTFKEDTAVKSHEVLLKTATNGDLQFDVHNSVANCQVNEGETVTVFSRPYTGYICKGITLKNTDTDKALDISVTPVDADGCAASEQAYSFTMPDVNVSVYASYEAVPGSVRFDTDKFIYNEYNLPVDYLKFNKDYSYIGWGAIPVSFAKGETAEFVPVCDGDHYLESVKAYEENTGNEIPVTRSGLAYSLTVGTEPIIVVPEFADLDSDKRATLQDRCPGGQVVFFADSDGQSLDYTQEIFTPGDTVTLNVPDEAAYHAISVTQEDGSALPSPVNLQWHADTKTVTFTMPNRNILIDIMLYYARFADIENGTGSFDADSAVPMRSYNPGDKVTFYLSLAFKTCLINYEVTSSLTSEEIPISFENPVPVLNGDRWETSYSFVMPEGDATVHIETAGCITATIDTSGNVYAQDGTPVAYIEFMNFSGPHFYMMEPVYYSTDPQLMPLGETTIRGRYVFDDDHKPKYITVTGASSGDLYQQLYWEGSMDFIEFYASLAHQPFEDLIVKACFENSEPVEPTTVEPTTVEPTTIAPTTVEPTTVAPTTEPVEPTTVEPTTEPPEPTTAEPTTVEPTTAAPTTVEPTTIPDATEHGIRTYDELLAFMERVNSGYNYDSAYLDTNILAPDDSVWSQGIGTDDKPFMGTFDGKGYGIIGLNVSGSKYGGLFGVIGSSGVVKDLMVIDCDFTDGSSTYAGGVAARNEGTIDHCTSGVNMPGNLKIKLPSGIKISPAEYNSLVMGTWCGGIAGVNKGTITGTRSGAYVSGENSGGVAAQNDGTIYGCANNGSIGSTSKSCLQAGGLAAINNGSIECSYNAGKVYCGSSAFQGAVAGNNLSDNVHKNYYSNINSIPSVGTDPGVKKLDSSNKLVEDKDMLLSPFVDQLNEVTDDTVNWRQTKYGDTYFNQGYPTIEGRFLQQRALALTSGITLRGMMHSSLQVTLADADKDSEAYQALAQQAGSDAAIYSPVTVDANGNYMPAELWTAGGLTLSVPVTSADAKLLILNEDNEVVTIAPDSVENGVAAFTIASPAAFAVTEAVPATTAATTPATTAPATTPTTVPAPSGDASSSTMDSASKDTPAPTTPAAPANGTVKTGDTIPVLIVITLLACFCGIVWIKRKRDLEQR